MIRLRDSIGAEVSLAAPGRRVVSLVPSITETVFALGAGSALVGCTTFCIHPAEGVARLAKVGGTKDPDVGRIRSLAPDLVLANQEENRRDDVLDLAKTLAVHVSYPRDLESLVAYLRDLGIMLGVERQARALSESIARARDDHARPLRAPRTLYLIWRRPWMAAAGDTFIDAMLRECGFENAVSSAHSRYPEIDLAGFRDALDLVLLSSEPFPFTDRHREEVSRECGLPPDRVRLVSGEAFSWFGARTAGVFAEASRALSALA